MRFCKVCRNYLFLKDTEEDGLYHSCLHCGFSEKMEAPSSVKESLILETRFGTSGGRQTVSQINEFTRQDPTLPHLRNSIPCPNDDCPSKKDTSLKDILYVKTDSKALKYQYCCLVCNTQWGN